ncbi:IclR family transcriptional regulator [Francisella persica ATCC VR-331]|uniref:IclR family transcriptional regulator n=1 Tax=Francisella persica ATCC VR-331 TaxID=1086726 RepID=A0AAC8VDS1_9GAMM|nr:IclR family transcriptional regulator [Francisella persica]ALB01751.1 IclR family transcriptional regulator [Francisella persica ATCC VR-331]ANH78055.1 IclR family transcriptional regulator [Francisella persica ATCC VR-331]
MSKDKKIQVITRAVNVLKSISNEPGGMSLGDIAKQVDLPRSTVQRIVAALEAEGFTRSEGAGKILLGSEVFRLASSSYADIVSLTQSLLRKLSEKTRETVVLTQSDRADLIVVHRFIANRELQVIPRIGVLEKPIYNTAPGRALLALYSDDEIIEILGEEISANKELFTKLAKIRVNGTEFDCGKTIEGIVSIAIAVNTFLGSFGVSILIPQYRYDENKDFYLNELLKVKAQILAEIGVKGSKSY